MDCLIEDRIRQIGTGEVDLDPIGAGHCPPQHGATELGLGETSPRKVGTADPSLPDADPQQYEPTALPSAGRCDGP